MPGGSDRLIAGRYRLAAPIGQGGMGVVWRAYDEVLERDVAVKEVVFPASMAQDDQQLACARTLQEARAAARLNHPGIITVHDVVEYDGRPWMVMELFPGGSLADLIDEAGPLPSRQVAEIGLYVLDALCVAHAAGIVHRDIKPENVLVHVSRVVLTDFGAAAIQGDPALTHSGWIGTPAYMAPERARGVRDNPISDLWSLGATLYAAVEGRPPYTGADPAAVLSALLTSDPPSLRLAGPLAPVLIELMHRDMGQRLTAGRARDLLGRVAGSARHSSSIVRTPTEPASATAPVTDVAATPVPPLLVGPEMPSTVTSGKLTPTPAPSPSPPARVSSQGRTRSGPSSTAPSSKARQRIVPPTPVQTLRIPPLPYRAPIGAAPDAAPEWDGEDQPRQGGFVRKCAIIGGIAAIVALGIFVPIGRHPGSKTQSANSPAQAAARPVAPSPIPPKHARLLCDVRQTSGYAKDGSDCASGKMYSGDSIALKVNGLTHHAIRVLCRRGYHDKWSSSLGENVATDGNMCEALLNNSFSSDGKLFAVLSNPEVLGMDKVTWRLINPAGRTVLNTKYSFQVLETLTRPLPTPPS